MSHAAGCCSVHAHHAWARDVTRRGVWRGADLAAEEGRDFRLEPKGGTVPLWDVRAGTMLDGGGESAFGVEGGGGGEGMGERLRSVLEQKLC